MEDYRGAPLEDLVRTCAASTEADAWDEFVRRIQPVIATTVIRTARSWTELSRALIDDLVQETYLKLCAEQCRLLRDFRKQHEGSFLGFLKVVTANVVRDHFKAAVAVKRGSGVVGASLSEPGTEEPHSEKNSGPEHAVLISQIHEWLCRNTDNDRDRLVFWLYYRGGLTARDIASVPGIALSTKGVESVLWRLTSGLRTLLVRPATSSSGIAHEGFLSE